jgi:hypothetical protein
VSGMQKVGRLVDPVMDEGDSTGVMPMLPRCRRRCYVSVLVLVVVSWSSLEHLDTR